MGINFNKNSLNLNTSQSLQKAIVKADNLSSKKVVEAAKEAVNLNKSSSIASRFDSATVFEKDPTKPTKGDDGLKRSLWFDPDWIMAHLSELLHSKGKGNDSSIITLEDLKKLFDDPNFFEQCYSPCADILSREDFKVMLDFTKKVVIELYGSSGDINDILSRDDIASERADIINNFKAIHNSVSTAENTHGGGPRKISGWGNNFWAGYSAVQDEKAAFLQYSYMIPYGGGNMGGLGCILEGVLNGIIYACTGNSPFTSGTP